MSPRAAVLLAVALAACGFQPAGAGDDLGEDGGSRALVLRDDSAADFAVPGTLRDGLIVEPWGALAPIAYHVGGLRAYAANTARFGEPDAATWAAITAEPPAGAGFWAGPLVGDPVGVGLDSGDSWTYWAEGEVWLDAGITSFVIACDDTGFLELAPPGGDFTRVASARYGLGSGDFAAATAGWHAIRLALQEGIGDSRFDVQLSTGGGPLRPLAAPILRARVDDLRGAVLAGWDRSQLQGEAQRTLATADLIDADFGTGVPRDLGIGDPSYWSLRWSGQFYVTMPGTYQLRTESLGGHRLYVNGAVVTDRYLDVNPDHTAAVELAGGWNDLVLDYSHFQGPARMRLRVAGGPEPGLDRELPASRLRPLEPRGERVETGGDYDYVTIPDNAPTGGAEATVDIGGFVGATVRSVEVLVSLDHGRYPDLQLRLVHPGGDERILRANVDDGANGLRALRFTDTGFEGTPAAGTWRLRVNDTVPGNVGALRELQLAVHLAGGPEQVARTATYTSQVRDLGAGVVAIDRLRFGARTPPGGQVAVRLRGCDTPEQCLSAPWSAPMTDGTGAAPTMAPSRYVQYQIELTSDGEREPELDWIELEYRVPAT